MDIGVIGGGATGLLVSYNLGKFHDVTLYVRRSEQKDRVASKGIQQIGHDEKRHILVQQLNDLVEHELLIICVKSIHIDHIVKVIKQQAVTTPLLFLQNGMGHVPLFSSLNNELFVGVIEHGIVRENDFTFNHLGKGKIKVAAVTDSSKLVTLISKLTSDTFLFELETDWEVMLKEKLIVNAVINPLTALFNIKNRYIVENTYVKQLAKQLCLEVSHILKLPSDISWSRVKQIAINTGNNISSMRSDIVNKRQTEIEAILGYLLTITKGEYPLTKMMYQSICALQERNQS